MAPNRRLYPSVEPELESVPLQIYPYQSKASIHLNPDSKSPAPALNQLYLHPHPPPPRPYSSQSCHRCRSRCKRAHTSSHTTGSSNTRLCSTTSPTRIMSHSSSHTKSPSMSTLQVRQPINSRIARPSQRPFTPARSNSSRPRLVSHSQNEPCSPSKAGRSYSQYPSPSPSPGPAQHGYDGLPAMARSVSLQPTPRASAITTATPTKPSVSTAASTTHNAQHIRGETLSFTPEAERFRFGSRSPPASDDCPDMSRSSSLTSHSRTPWYTPSAKRPATDCISYFPPYDGESSFDPDEAEGQGEDMKGNQEGASGDGKGHPSEPNHSRGSSITAFASAILSSFAKISPIKPTIPLPEVDDTKPPNSETVTKPGPVKLVPVPTAEWPCEPSIDKQRRSNPKSKAEDVPAEKMMLISVRREGPRNKDDPENEQSEEDEEPVSTRRKPKPNFRLPIPPMGGMIWRHPMQSPPVVALSPITAFPFIEHETPEQEINLPILTSDSDTIKPRKQEVTSKSKTTRTRAPLQEIIKPIDSAHIPSLHRSRSRTVRDENTEGSSTRRRRVESASSPSRSRSRNSPVRAHFGHHYLFPANTQVDIDPNPAQSTPIAAPYLTPPGSEAGDDFEDMDQTPRPGRGGWIALSQATEYVDDRMRQV